MKIVVKNTMVDAEYTIGKEASMSDVLDAFVNAALIETYPYGSIMNALKEKAEEMKDDIKNALPGRVINGDYHESY